ncbi:MAG: type II secretion system F family protein [Actinomycetota bacterium]|nr:type II secretion system F family protein [Actinomycetota bacterium]
MSALVAALGAAGVVLIVSGIPYVRRARLRDRVEPYLAGLHGRPSALIRRSSAPRVRLGALVRVAWRAGGKDARLTERLAAAGRDPDPDAFRLEQLTWGVAASVTVCALAAGAASLGGTVDVAGTVVLGILALMAGSLGRDYWLSRQVRERVHGLREELPAAIDLITLSIVSGESVAAAFARVSQILRTPVGEELRAVTADVRAGVPILDALEALGARVPDPSFARFVDALCTGIERGAPLADVLRAQADDGREAKRRSLFESAGRREVLMLIPVVFLIMPVVVMFALYPGIVSLDLLVK